MSTKGIVAILLLTATAFFSYSYFHHSKENIIENEESKIIEKISFAAQDLHSDILKIIVDEKNTVFKITQKEAKDELLKRETKMSDADKKAADVHSLPFDVLSYISKSPTTIAGISPKVATNEIIRKYLLLDRNDSEISFYDMLSIYKDRSAEQKAIDKWADNEDVEEMEKFMKEAADKDFASIEAFAYGVKHMKDKVVNAKAYLKKFAANTNGVDVHSENEKKSYDELIKAIESMENPI